MKRSVNSEVRDTPPLEQCSRAQWIKRLQEDGAEVLGQYILLRYKVGGTVAPQVAIVVSRRIGKAFVRNKIKRRLRNIWRTSARFRLSPGHYLFIARSSIVKVKFRDIERDLLNVINGVV